MLPTIILSDSGRLPERPPPRELGFNHFSNSGCPGFAIAGDRRPDLLLHPTPPNLAKLTSLVEHGVVADQAP